MKEMSVLGFITCTDLTLGSFKISWPAEQYLDVYSAHSSSQIVFPTSSTGNILSHMKPNDMGVKMLFLCHTNKCRLSFY